MSVYENNANHESNKSFTLGKQAWFASRLNEGAFIKNLQLAKAYSPLDSIQKKTFDDAQILKLFAVISISFWPSHLQTGGMAWLQAVRQARDESRLVVVANSCLLVAANVQMCNHAFLLPTKKPGFSRIDICFNSLAIRMTKLAHFSGIFHPTFSPYSFLGYTSESNCLSS